MDLDLYTVTYRISEFLTGIIARENNSFLYSFLVYEILQYVLDKKVLMLEAKIEDGQTLLNTLVKLGFFGSGWAVSPYLTPRIKELLVGEK
jgi:hypothetical protein